MWVWPAGLRFLWRSGRPLWRALAWAYGLLFVLFALTTGAQIYYLADAYPYLLAAGFVAIDRWLAARPGRVRNLLLATALTTAALATAATWPGFSPACSRWPRCRTRPGSATRNGAATSTWPGPISPWAQLWPLLRHYD